MSNPVLDVSIIVTWLIGHPQVSRMAVACSTRIAKHFSGWVTDYEKPVIMLVDKEQRMIRNEKDNYDWLNDPFDEKKAARERMQAVTPTGTKVALGCGCALVVVGIIALLVFVAINMMDILASV